MDNQKKLIEPSIRTKAHVEEALKAFGIALSMIKVYGFRQNEDLASSGFANSITQIIGINEEISDLDSIAVSFHEAAHIKDDTSNKIEIYAKYLTGITLIPYIGLFPRTFLFLERIIISPLVLMMMSASYGALGTSLGFWFYQNAAIPWSIEQGEYRADKLAIEKMVSLNHLDPILLLLADKQILKETHGEQRFLGHPPAGAEYKAIKRNLENHGYVVTKFHSGDILEISLTQDGNGRSIRKTYNKV